MSLWLSYTLLCIPKWAIMYRDNNNLALHCFCLRQSTHRVALYIQCLGCYDYLCVYQGINHLYFLLHLLLVSER